MNQKIVPFGMLFEESALEPEIIIVPFYDENSDISYIQNEEGELIPYVESLVVAGLGTETGTKVKTETTDQDPSPPPKPKTTNLPRGTETFTEVAAEVTQRDY